MPAYYAVILNFDISIATNITQQESSARPYFFVQVIITLHHSSAHCTHLTFIWLATCSVR